jgi:hypothetical protein
VKSDRLLVGEDLLYPRGRLSGALIGPSVDAQGAPVGCELVDIDDTQPSRGEGSGGGQERYE